MPSQVVEVVTRFARRLNKEVAWGDIQQLLVLINQVHCCFNILNLVETEIRQCQHVAYDVENMS